MLPDWLSSPHLGPSEVDGLPRGGLSTPVLRRHPALTAEAKECLDGSITKSTRNRYDQNISKWKHYCEKNDIADPTSAGVNNIVNYLSSLFKSGLALNTVSAHRSAISSFHCFVDGAPIGQHHLVAKCVRGIRKFKPPTPRYAATWDVGCVLDLLAGSRYNPNSEIPFIRLKHKTAMLILISTACRQSVLTRLQCAPDYLVLRGDHYVLHPSGWDKNSRSTHKVHPFLIFDHPERPEISPFLCLKAYLSRAPAQDSNFETVPLFLSDFKNFQVSLDELRKWLSSIMGAAGVPDHFKVHSVRGAVTSKAASVLPTAAIMEAVDWKSEDVFRKFYLRNIGSSVVENRRAFQAAIL